VSKKIDDLSDNIKGLRIQIAEIKADRESTDVSLMGFLCLKIIHIF
jgi:hypothetical protein